MTTAIDRASHGLNAITCGVISYCAYKTHEFTSHADTFFEKYFFPCQSGLSSEKICTLIGRVEASYNAVLKNIHERFSVNHSIFPIALTGLSIEDYTALSATFIFGFLALDACHRTVVGMGKKERYGLFDRFMFATSFLGFGALSYKFLLLDTYTFYAFEKYKYFVNPCRVNNNIHPNCVSVQQIWNATENLIHKTDALVKEYADLESISCEKNMIYDLFEKLPKMETELKTYLTVYTALFVGISLTSFYKAMFRYRNRND